MGWAGGYLYGMIDSARLGVLNFEHRLKDVGQKGKDVNNDKNGLEADWLYNRDNAPI